MAGEPPPKVRTDEHYRRVGRACLRGTALIFVGSAMASGIEAAGWAVMTVGVAMFLGALWEA